MLCCPAWKPTREARRHRYKERRDKKHRSEWGWCRGKQREEQQSRSRSTEEKRQTEQENMTLFKKWQKCMRTRRHSSVRLDTKKKSHIGPVHVADWHTSFWVILEQDGPIGMGDWMAKAGDWAVRVEDGVTGRTVKTKCRTMGSFSTLLRHGGHSGTPLREPCVCPNHVTIHNVYNMWKRMA